jgi:hypothetical protein
MKTHISPRQARDKHRDNSKKELFSHRGPRVRAEQLPRPRDGVRVQPHLPPPPRRVAERTQRQEIDQEIKRKVRKLKEKSGN